MANFRRIVCKLKLRIGQLECLFTSLKVCPLLHTLLTPMLTLCFQSAFQPNTSRFGLQ